MNTPEWPKPGLYGAGAGAVALAIIGFSWGGWATGAKAKQMALERAKIEVVAALVPICIDQSANDPQLAEKISLLKSANSYDRSDMVMKIGWATMPGAADSNSQAARACVEKLAAVF